MTWLRALISSTPVISSSSLPLTTSALTVSATNSSKGICVLLTWNRKRKISHFWPSRKQTRRKLGVTQLCIIRLIMTRKTISTTLETSVQASARPSLPERRSLLALVQINRWSPQSKWNSTLKSGLRIGGLKCRRIIASGPNKSLWRMKNWERLLRQPRPERNASWSILARA